MVPDVEEFGAEFHVHLLSNREHFENGKIPVLQTRSAHDVPASIAEGKEGGVVGKGASIEYGSGNAGLGIRIADQIRPHFEVSHGAAAIGGRDVGDRVGDGEPVASLGCGDASHLPIPDDLVEHTVGISAESLPLSERQFVSVVDNEALTHVEVRVAVVDPRSQLISKVAVVERAEAGAGGVVK